MQIFVMPAWMAGTQVRKDASGDIHVNLDSSTPCWNDAMEEVLLELTEAPPPRIFKGAHEGPSAAKPQPKIRNISRKDAKAAKKIVIRTWRSSRVGGRNLRV